MRNERNETINQQLPQHSPQQLPKLNDLATARVDSVVDISNTVPAVQNTDVSPINTGNIVTEGIEVAEVVDNSQLPELSRKELRFGHKHSTKVKLLRDLAVIFVVAMILSVVIKSFFLQPFLVPSGSMENTLIPGDKILVSKISLYGGINKGDVVVFHDTKGWLNQNNVPEKYESVPLTTRILQFIGLEAESDDSYLVKRVIGTSGDHVTCAGADAPIKINGYPVQNEPFLKPNAAHSRVPFDVVVPDGKLWVMGDNRSYSADSRLNTDKLGQGFIDEVDVVGKVFAILSPWDRLSFIEDQTYNFADVPEPLVDDTEGGADN